MPTKYKPQLDHQHHRWDDRFMEELQLKRNEILEAVRMKQKRLARKPPELTFDEKEELLRDIDAALSLAAAIRIDSDTLPVNMLIATLQAIEKKPSFIACSKIEPEALATLAGHYQRDSEPLGTHSTDVFELDDIAKIDAVQVQKAAARAIASVRDQATVGRRTDQALAELGASLRDIYLQHNPTARRASVVTSRKGELLQMEGGRFFLFVELVVAPLNKYLAAHPNKPRLFPPAEVVRKAKHAFPGRSKYVRH